MRCTSLFLNTQVGSREGPGWIWRSAPGLQLRCARRAIRELVMRALPEFVHCGIRVARAREALPTVPMSWLRAGRDDLQRLRSRQSLLRVGVRAAGAVQHVACCWAALPKESAWRAQACRPSASLAAASGAKSDASRLFNSVPRGHSSHRLTSAVPGARRWMWYRRSRWW